MATIPADYPYRSLTPAMQYSTSITINQTNGTSVQMGAIPPDVSSSYPQTSNSTIPITISSGGYIYSSPVPQDEIKSEPVDTGEHTHYIHCRLRVESTKVISEYYCNHCEEVLFSKVISKIPKSIIKKRCLPRILKGV